MVAQPLFEKEADAEVFDTVVVDALVGDAKVLDPEVADAEVADVVVDWFVLGTALNLVPIPNKEDAAFLDKEVEDLNAMV
jgi:hypothetical protein